MRLRTLGFMSHEEWQRIGKDSWRPFDGYASEFSLWQRVRLALLLLAGRDLSRLHIPWAKGKGPTIDKVSKWVEANRNPAAIQALRDAVEAFGDEEKGDRPWTATS